MMTLKTKKQVRETAAGSSVDAFVILDPSGEHIATVQSVRLNSGNVMVDVWNKSTLIHQGMAQGGGYDKYTAALAGAVIDGIKIFNHCAQDDITGKLLAEYKGIGGDKFIEAEVKAIGARFANWKKGNDGTGNGMYSDLYYESGLERLRVMGYTIIQAI